MRWTPLRDNGIVDQHSRIKRSSRARAMQFRVVTLNIEQDHKRWSDRHPLISAEIAGLRPDLIAFNEVSVPLQTAKLLRDVAIATTGIPYKLVQQTRVNAVEAGGRSAVDPVSDHRNRQSRLSDQRHR